MALDTPLRVLAIDPGPTESGYVLLGSKILDMGKVDNDYMEGLIFSKIIAVSKPLVAVEIVKSYGMPAGDSLFRTMWYCGRFSLAVDMMGYFYEEVTRKEVVTYMCGTSKAGDSNVRQALIDRFEPGLEPRHRPKGFLKGVSNDIWSALAIAVYVRDNYDLKHKRIWKGKNFLK